MSLATMTPWLVTAAFLAIGQPSDDLLSELQRAIARDDRAAVAALIRYPIVVTAGEVRIPIADAAALAQSYDAVFTPELKAAIRSGSAVRDKLIRIATAGGAQKIAGITLPAPRRGAAGGPSRIVPGTQQRPAQLSGSLAQGGSDTYVAYVAKGRLLDARLERVRGRDVVLRVVDANTGKPVDARAGAGARVWTGRVPDSGDYRIEVTREAQAGGELLPYVLAVRVR